MSLFPQKRPILWEQTTVGPNPLFSDAQRKIGGTIYPVMLLYEPSGSSVDSRPFLTWAQRVRKAKTDGFIATLVGRTPKLLELDEATLVNHDRTSTTKDRCTLRTTALPSWLLAVVRLNLDRS
jgi:hypothetical protein